MDIRPCTNRQSCWPTDFDGAAYDWPSSMTADMADSDIDCHHWQFVVDQDRVVRFDLVVPESRQVSYLMHSSTVRGYFLMNGCHKTSVVAFDDDCSSRHWHHYGQSEHEAMIVIDFDSDVAVGRLKKQHHYAGHLAFEAKNPIIMN